MKEIDFLPNWYKDDIRRRMSYRTQYIALAGAFVVIMVWNAVTTHAISRAATQLVQQAVRQTEAAAALLESAGLKGKVTKLQEKAEAVREIDSKIDLANILAEISFLLDEKMVLSKVEITAEEFVDKQKTKPNSGSAVRAVRVWPDGKSNLRPSDVRFKVVISGVATDASDVADLTTRLEHSPYFCLVYPSYSRPKTIKPIRSSTVDHRDPKSGLFNGVRPEIKLVSNTYQVSEFEIGCYLANYKIN